MQDDEIYWPDENTSLKIGHTTVTYKGSEVKDATTILKLETKIFKKVTEEIRFCLILNYDTHECVKNLNDCFLPFEKIMHTSLHIRACFSVKPFQFQYVFSLVTFCRIQ